MASKVVGWRLRATMIGLFVQKQPQGKEDHAGTAPRGSPKARSVGTRVWKTRSCTTMVLEVGMTDAGVAHAGTSLKS